MWGVLPRWFIIPRTIFDKNKQNKNQAYPLTHILLIIKTLPSDLNLDIREHISRDWNRFCINPIGHDSISGQ